MPRKQQPRKKQPRNDRTINLQKAFISAYAACASISQAARAAGVDHKRHYEWMSDEAYRHAFDAVTDQAAQAVEDEAVRRAVEGVKRPMYYRGKQVRTGGRRGRTVYEVEYSDTLLLALLKRFRPKFYREHTVTEVSGSIDLVERLNAGRQRLVEMRKQEEAG